MTPDAVKAVVDRAPELTDDQRAKIRTILLTALPADKADAPAGHNGAPRTRVPGRRDHPAAAKQQKGRGHHATAG